MTPQELIKSIHKFALSYTQEFSLAVLCISNIWHVQEQLCFFQSKLSKVFVHVSRCLIYKVHRCSRGQLWYTTTPSSICQEVFSLFFVFFDSFFTGMQRGYILYSICVPSTMERFFRHFAHFLSKIFEDIYKNFCQPLFFRKNYCLFPKCCVYLCYAVHSKPDLYCDHPRDIPQYL